jgi:lysozyme
LARKKKSNKPLIIGFSLLMLLLIAGSLYYMNRPRFIRYPAFGISIPRHYEIHGIDVSKYQHRIEWQDVQQMQVDGVKIGFCFIKATEGVSSVDSRFHRNWKGARNVGLPRGAYHYFIPTRSGKEQAKNFIDEVEIQPGDLPPVLDIEVLQDVNKAVLQQRVFEWLQLVEAKYGMKPIIYTGADFYTKNLADKFSDYPLWVAHYLVKDKPRVYRDWHFWQHNEAGRVNGIDAPVDFNVFCGDSTDFVRLLKK